MENEYSYICTMDYYDTFMAYNYTLMYLKDKVYTYYNKPGVMAYLIDEEGEYDYHYSGMYEREDNFFKIRNLISLAEWRDKQIDEILK